jgi:hypothetical protein
MPIYVSAPKYELAPTGLHPAVCVDVVDLGECESTWNGKTTMKHKLQVRWQLETNNEEGYRFLVTKRYTASLHPNAALRQDLASWRSRDFTPEELEQFDVEKLIGVPCQLNLTHNDVNGTTYTNISTIVPAPRGYVLEPENYTRVKDRERNGGNGADETVYTDDGDPIPF